MVSTREIFSSLDMSKCPPIVLGDNSLTDSMGKGRIDLDHGNFNHVLYVPVIASNILSLSPSGYVYYVSFIDEFSRKTWIYFMKNKDEVFSKGIQSLDLEPH